MIKKIYLTAVCVLAVFIFFSCASSYIKPSITTQVYRHKVQVNTEFIFKLVQRLLPMAGYNVLNSDDASGMITTAPVEMTLDPDNCDCGRAMGQPVVKSGGIKVRVSFEVGIRGKEIIVNAVIAPDLSGVLGVLYSGIDIVCISKGMIEKQLVKNILKKIQF